MPLESRLLERGVSDAGRLQVAFEVTNVGEDPATVRCRFTALDADGWTESMDSVRIDDPVPPEQSESYGVPTGIDAEGIEDVEFECEGRAATS